MRVPKNRNGTPNHCPYSRNREKQVLLWSFPLVLPGSEGSRLFEVLGWNIGRVPRRWVRNIVTRRANLSDSNMSNKACPSGKRIFRCEAIIGHILI